MFKHVFKSWSFNNFLVFKYIPNESIKQIILSWKVQFKDLKYHLFGFLKYGWLKYLNLIFPWTSFFWGGGVLTAPPITHCSGGEAISLGERTSVVVPLLISPSVRVTFPVVNPYSRTFRTGNQKKILVSLERERKYSCGYGTP